LGMDYEKLTRVMRTLALEAGDKIMEIYGQDDFEVKSKSDDSPVTAADEAADKIISDGLRAAFPDVLLVTEEQSATHSTTADTFLIVDPLDGTKEFIHRRGVEETGAFDKERVGQLTPISVSKPDNSALMVVASKSHRDQATDDYIGKYGVKDMKSAGSSLKFCLVATGEADIYPRVGRTMEWDTAAGHAVLKGAGGEVVRFDDHSVLTYGKAEYANPFFIAYAPGVDLKDA